ncbi:hypothetical protein F2Q68_00017569 [Brassica cretica]|nr:hypothetical protein F2Q68_00017569 [Brassica cretica]
MYREDREVNLALKVADLLEVNTGRWNRELVYETFALGVMNNNRLEMSTRRAVPWVLWQIWKARNSLAFKNTSLSPRQAVRTAFEEAELWFLANSPQRDSEPTPTVKTWIKPPIGRTVAHSRRSYSAINSGKEAHITALLWAVESMHNMRQNNIIFETSTEDTIEIMLSSSLYPSLHYLTSQITALLHKFEYWSLDHAADERNVAANMIAGSVTTGHRYQSYIASQGPAMLHSLLSREARG